MNTFYIKSTGFGDNTSQTQYDNTFGLIELFFEKVCNKITSKIPNNFTQIVITHHDILVNADKYKLNKTYMEYVINEYIRLNNHILDSRIISHTFTINEIDIHTIEYPHIIIDGAHLFEYRQGKIISYNDYYDREYTGEPLPICAIYIGWFNKFIAEQDLIKVSQNGDVETFINCLDDAGFIEHTIHDPIELMMRIIQEIKCKLMRIWRDKKGKVRDDGIFDKMFSSFNIFRQIINKLFAKETKEQIMDIETYDFYEQFILDVENPNIF